jgi:pyruvate dehydrogenase E2 component (dihydrolipoamide acetyltransferase)
MATKVVMEALSPTMEEGRLVKWLKNEGEQVKNGETLAEVETDNAIMELVARGEGVLRKRLLNENDAAPVGQLIAVIAAPDENIDALVSGGGASAPQAPAPATAPADVVAPPATSPAQGKVASAPPAPPPRPDQLLRPHRHPRERQRRTDAIFPLARRMASESGLDLQAVQGSGPGGRIIKRDIGRGASRGARAAAGAAIPDARFPIADYRDDRSRRSAKRSLAALRIHRAHPDVLPHRGIRHGAGGRDAVGHGCHGR